MYGLKTDWPEDASPRYLTLEDYERHEPRWCPGCGDHAVLTAVQRMCRDEQLPLEQPMPDTNTVFSGGSCSSRQSRWTAVRTARSPHPGHQRGVMPS